MSHRMPLCAQGTQLCARFSSTDICTQLRPRAGSSHIGAEEFPGLQVWEKQQAPSLVGTVSRELCLVLLCPDTIQANAPACFS